MAKRNKQNHQAKRNSKNIGSKKVVAPVKLGAHKLAAESKLPAGQQKNTEADKIVKSGNSIQPHLASAYTVINISKKKKNTSNVECIFIAICTGKQKPWETLDFGKRIGAESALGQLKSFLFVNR